MGYLPVLLNMKTQRVLVVGGGRAATIKVCGLLRSEAEVLVVSPEISPELLDKVRANQLRWVSRKYRPEDLDAQTLVFAATDDVLINRDIVEEARRRGIWAHHAGMPETGHFILPAVLQTHGVTVTVSTLGRAPFLAKAIRRWLESEIDDSMDHYLTVLSQVREWVMKNERPDRRRDVLEWVLSLPIREWLEKRPKEAVLAIVIELLETSTGG